MKLHIWCELSDKLVNTIWQIYGQKQRRAITILFCGRGTLLNYLSILSTFWKFPDQEIKVFFTFMKVFFSKIFKPLFSSCPSSSLAWSGARFTNDFLPAIQIRWKLRLVITPLLAIRSQQIFAHALVKIIGNRLTRDPKIVIHGYWCIILYFTTCHYYPQ